ncbi:MAG TPA: hypothetical protein VFV58_24030 [Blastocatellia bacterium]|jgi:hypothetical protein|nr:hypothetical protein [Blastocatellia bacterium]
MTATTILNDLKTRGIRIWAETGQLKLDAPHGAITPEIQMAIRDHKAEMLTLLRSKTAERPRIGSFARPRVVHATRALSNCPWPTCGGHLTTHGHNLYLCSICETWFELMSPEDLGVYVGDLSDRDDQIAAK